ncbi:hypothetical protein [Levilactobacillus brevis]|uniref:hypothetical protein n=1 Tax=Levilactobacillus brevis TaxID=1580 RepID=UPI00063A8C33|nr:hypothetical protein [Levilactobacillus brevis]KLE28831.1 hypothetical protein AAX72_11715 [Levilactobacillus brevis]MCT3569074.1 hypothetical protein [Levilactobacillus brevis]MCT3579938.1 hypothetical protein [Levilactobacillus brevis]
MTNEELFEQAEELTRAWESLKVSIDLLSMDNTVAQHDAELPAYFFNSHQSSNLESNLANIADTMLKVSNAICPKE